VLEDREAVAMREQVCHGDECMSDLVLLHGIGTGPEAWAPQLDAFSSTRRVLTPRVPLDLGRAVEELQAVDAARFDLCGLSWGARRAPFRPPKSRPSDATCLLSKGGGLDRAT